MTTSPLVTILDDSLDVRDLLSDALEQAGFQTRSFARATEFEAGLRALKPDVCIIDLSLPDRDGLTLLQTLTSQSHAAILIISGRTGVQDRIVGLELGADDYLTKPFEVGEVVARVRALLRRARSDLPANGGQVVRFSGWTLDLEQHLLIDGRGEAIRLSAGECQVLRIFLNAPNRLITREHILNQLDDGTGDFYDRTIDVRVSRLRAKLRDDPNNPAIIKTIYGAGYIFIANVES